LAAVRDRDRQMEGEGQGAVAVTCPPVLTPLTNDRGSTSPEAIFHLQYAREFDRKASRAVDCDLGRQGYGGAEGAPIAVWSSTSTESASGNVSGIAAELT
jgi:hypothetical protein